MVASSAVIFSGETRTCATIRVRRCRATSKYLRQSGRARERARWRSCRRADGREPTKRSLSVKAGPEPRTKCPFQLRATMGSGRLASAIPGASATRRNPLTILAMTGLGNIRAANLQQRERMASTARRAWVRSPLPRPPHLFRHGADVIPSPHRSNVKQSTIPRPRCP